MLIKAQSLTTGRGRKKITANFFTEYATIVEVVVEGLIDERGKPISVNLWRSITNDGTHDWYEISDLLTDEIGRALRLVRDLQGYCHINSERLDKAHDWIAAFKHQVNEDSKTITIVEGGA